MKKILLLLSAIFCSSMIHAMDNMNNSERDTAKIHVFVCENNKEKFYLVSGAIGVWRYPANHFLVREYLARSNSPIQRHYLKSLED